MRKLQHACIALAVVLSCALIANAQIVPIPFSYISPAGVVNGSIQPIDTNQNNGTSGVPWNFVHSYRFVAYTSFQLNGTPFAIVGTPSISSGFGTSPSVLTSNNEKTFRVNVGTGGVATTGVILMSAAATTGFNCAVVDMTTNIVTRETSSTTTTVTVTAASAWTASDTLLFTCDAY